MNSVNVTPAHHHQLVTVVADKDQDVLVQIKDTSNYSNSDDKETNNNSTTDHDTHHHEENNTTYDTQLDTKKTDIVDEKRNDKARSEKQFPRVFMYTFPITW